MATKSQIAKGKAMLDKASKPKVPEAQQMPLPHGYKSKPEQMPLPHGYKPKMQNMGKEGRAKITAPLNGILGGAKIQKFAKDVVGAGKLGKPSMYTSPSKAAPKQIESELERAWRQGKAEQSKTKIKPFTSPLQPKTRPGYMSRSLNTAAKDSLDKRNHGPAHR